MFHGRSDCAPAELSPPQIGTFVVTVKWGSGKFTLFGGPGHEARRRAIRRGLLRWNSGLQYKGERIAAGVSRRPRRVPKTLYDFFDENTLRYPDFARFLLAG
jgi:hypothetical protein